VFDQRSLAPEDDAPDPPEDPHMLVPMEEQPASNTASNAAASFFMSILPRFAFVHAFVH
jgi:hypothetical protein